MKKPTLEVSVLLKLAGIGIVILLFALDRTISNMEMIPGLLVQGTLFLVFLVLIVISAIYDKRLKKGEKERRKTDPALEKLVRRRGFIVWTSVILGLYVGTGMVLIFAVPGFDATLRWIFIALYATIDLVATLFYVRFLSKMKQACGNEAVPESCSEK